MPTKTRSPIKKIVHFITETGMLMLMPRSHKRHLGNTFDTVSSHSHHTGIIAYCITRMEGYSHDEALKALAIGILHDNVEARTNDLDFLAKHYAKTDEAKAIHEQYDSLPFGKDLEQLVHEYETRDTQVAKCAKDADIIEQLYQEWMLMHMGNQMAERWFIGDYIHRVPFLRTKSAKKIALQLKKTKPHDWWFEELVEKSGPNRDFLNGKK